MAFHVNKSRTETRLKKSRFRKCLRRKTEDARFRFPEACEGVQFIAPKAGTVVLREAREASLTDRHKV